MLVEDRQPRLGKAQHQEVQPARAQGHSEASERASSWPEPGAVSSFLGFLRASPSADNQGQASSIQPSFGSSAWEDAASKWLQQTFIADDQKSGKADLRCTRSPCCLAEGLTIDVHGTVLGVSRAVDVFRGALVILWTWAQVVHTLSSLEQRLNNDASLVLCNVASLLCYPGLMLACGYSSYERFLREWPDPGTYNSWDLLGALLLPLTSAWISAFAFCFLDPTLNLEEPLEVVKQVLLFGGGRPEGAEILMALSVNFCVVYVVWRPASGVLHSIKARVWHDAFAFVLALSPLALLVGLKTLSLEARSGIVMAALPYLLHVHLGILAAACWDRFLSQLQPAGLQTVTDSIHLLPWDVFKGWLALGTAAWWVAFILFIPLGQVALIQDLTSQAFHSPLERSALGPPASGFPSPLWLLASVWPLAVCVVTCGLIVVVRNFNPVVRWMDLELSHVGQNLLYYMVVINIFLASQQRNDPHRGSASLSRCFLGALSILAASRFIHFMAGLSRKAVPV